MAICRCKKDHPPKSPNHSNNVNPIGYPITSAICGIKDCKEPALIWLDDDETIAYNNKGKRIFYLHTRKIQVKAVDKGLNSNDDN